MINVFPPVNVMNNGGLRLHTEHQFSFSVLQCITRVELSDIPFHLIKYDFGRYLITVGCVCVYICTVEYNIRNHLHYDTI